MVAFRKMFPALAGLTLLLGASSAFGQVTTNPGGTGTALACVVTAGVPPIVRAEGYTELLGDVLITCQGGDPAAPFLANFQLFLNTTVTSRLLENATNLTEALLLIDEPGVINTGGLCSSPGVASNTAGFGGTIAVPSPTAPTCNPLVPAAPPADPISFQTGTYNAFLGQVGGLGAQSNSVLTWAGIPIVPPGSNHTRTIRITNVRANAVGIGVSSTFLPNQIIGFISVSPTGSLPLSPPQVTMAFVQQGLQFDTRNCGNTDSLGTSGRTFDACVNRGGSQFRPGGTPGTDPTAGLAAHAALRFREGFPTAFKPRAVLGNEGPVNTATTFNSESGLIRSVTTFGEIGRATTGTRLAARFTNIPSNVRIFVSQSNVTTGVGAGATQGNALLVQSTDMNGSGGTVVGGLSSFALTCGTLTTGTWITDINPNETGVQAGAGAAEVPVIGGTGLAVWEVQSSTALPDDFVFLVGAAFAAAGTNAVGIGTGNVNGTFAPFYAVPATPSGPALSQPLTLYPIPRFAPSDNNPSVVTTSPCLTALLFPYVTNWSGFDTGLSISNTSRDPFSSPNDRLQSGTCTLNYYGTLAGQEPPTTPGPYSFATQTTTNPVAAGETITMVLSSGGVPGLTGIANFQGYIIATCNFRFAHGFAFITDGPIGQARVAEGYLALVLSGPGQARGITESGEVRGH